MSPLPLSVRYRGARLPTRVRSQPRRRLKPGGAAKEMTMQAMCKTTGVAVALVIVFTVAARADEPKAPPTPEGLIKALAEAGKPGPEHKKLEPLIGRWNFAIKFWTDPSQPP